MRIRTATAAVALLAAVGLLTGCSSSSDSKATSEPGVHTAAPIQQVAKLDAKGITQRLIAAVPSVTMKVDYTAATDPNGKMGRPHQYVSKTAFADSRVSKNPKAADESNHRPDAISYGGTVEVFATVADANAWTAYIDKLGQALGGMVTPDYVLQRGRYVIRASDLLTPAQVDGYKAVLTKLA